MAKGHKTGGGSRRGKPNKATAALKDMILDALDKAGGVRYLADRAKDTPAAFMSLIGRLVPTTLSGPDGGPIEHRIAGAKGELDAALARLAERIGSPGVST